MNYYGSPSHRLALGCALLAGLATSGCKPGSTLKTVPVTGTVKLDGAPLANATVGFIGSGEASKPASGVTDANGKYKLVTFELASTPVEGAVPGQYSVIVTKRESSQPAALSQMAQSSPEEMQKRMQQMTPEEAQKMGGPMVTSRMPAGPQGKSEIGKGKSEIPVIYSDPTNSGLHATVPDAGPQTIDFELQSKK